MLKQIITILLFSISLYSQVTGGIDMKDLLKDDLESKMGMEKQIAKESLPVGNEVNPEFYIVGPGDYLTLRIIPQFSNNQMIQVLPDGTLILPRNLGELNVKGMTLANVQKLVEKKIKEETPNSRIFVSLYQSRIVLVSINGNTESPSTYSFPASYRISTVLQYINQKQLTSSSSQMAAADRFNKQNYDKSIEQRYSQSGLTPKSIYSTRNIVYSIPTKQSQVLDVEKALVEEDFVNNPYLIEGSKIYIPFEDKFYPQVAITGAVLRPSNIAYKIGDKASLLLKFGLALTENADLSNVELIRANGDIKKLSLDKNMKLTSGDFDLEPGDKILVGGKKYNATYQNGVVSVKGAVRNESVYSILNNSSRLKDILQKAEVEENALLEQAYLVRKTSDFNFENDNLKIYEAVQNTDLTFEDTTRLFNDLKSFPNIASVDFESLVKNNSDKDNILLQDGDLIVIPRKQNRVLVFGRVNKPGYIDFVSGKDYMYYINKAGGQTEESDFDRTRVIRGYTNNWLDPEKLVVKDGDKIYVPSEIHVPTQFKDSRYGLIAGIIGASSGVLFLILNSGLFK